MAARRRVLISVGLGRGIQLRSSMVMAMEGWVVAARARAEAVPRINVRRFMAEELQVAGRLGPGFARRHRRAGCRRGGESVRRATPVRRPPGLLHSFWRGARTLPS